MAGDDRRVNIKNISNSPISGVAGGDLSGQVSVAINSLPNSDNLNQPGIKELLVQLNDAIAPLNPIPSVKPIILTWLFS